MKNLKIIYLWSLFLFGFYSASAQTHRYMVFLSDKAESIYSLDEPEAFLSTRAIARKIQHNVEINVLDLPVSTTYIQDLASLELDVFFTSKWMNAVLIQTDSSTLLEVIGRSYVDSVVFIAPGARLTHENTGFEWPDTFQEPNNPLESSELQLAMMNVHQMHEDGYRGEGMLIAVLDAGFKGAQLFKPLENIFKENRLIAAKDFVTNGGNPFLYSGHGTSAWSTIASDYKDFIGTAPKAEFILCITEDVASEYRIEEYNWLVAAEYADSLGADIITSSLGYSSFSDGTMNYTYQDMDGQTAIITRASNLAIKKGLLVITSAGNEGNDPWRYITAPADGPDNITVGSVKSDYSISSFSSQGPTADDRIKPDVVALGQGTTLLTSNGSISQASGTSFSAPLVAGFSAGIWQAHPEFTNLEVVDYLRNLGTRFDNPDNYFGYGIPIYLANEDSLVVTDTTMLSLSEFTSDSITIYPNPVYGNVISIKIDSKINIYPLDIKLLDLEGNNVCELNVLNLPLGGLISMDISNSHTGIYILILSSDNISRKIKLIKY
tara:strand:+ start:33 stop:1682 length:1650 start_codon:yes stop_codon:yes gene_type:complete